MLVAFIVLTNQSSYTLHIPFQDASGLVPGNDVLIGPAHAGTVQSVGLTANGQADVVISLSGGAAPVHEGTVARIEDSGLAALAGNYVVLVPGPSGAPAIPSGGWLPAHDAYAEVSLDQLFDALEPADPRRDLERDQRVGRVDPGPSARRQPDPALPGSRRCTRRAASRRSWRSDEPAFDGLLVQGARAMQALAARSQELTALIANADVATGAIAQQSRALQTALALLPQTLTRSTDTFTGLRATLDTLDPVVAAAIPATRRLTPFAQQLGHARDRRAADGAGPLGADPQPVRHRRSHRSCSSRRRRWRRSRRRRSRT